MTIRDSSLYNEDLAPVPADGRTWGTWNIAALWVGMAVCIPTYTLAAGLIAQASGGSIRVAPVFESLYTYAWFVSLLIAAIAYIFLSTAFPPRSTEARGENLQGATR